MYALLSSELFPEMFGKVWREGRKHDYELSFYLLWHIFGFLKHT